MFFRNTLTNRLPGLGHLTLCWVTSHDLEQRLTTDMGLWVGEASVLPRPLCWLTSVHFNGVWGQRRVETFSGSQWHRIHWDVMWESTRNKLLHWLLKLSFQLHLEAAGAVTSGHRSTSEHGKQRCWCWCHKLLSLPKHGHPTAPFQYATENSSWRLQWLHHWFRFKWRHQERRSLALEC